MQAASMSIGTTVCNVKSLANLDYHNLTCIMCFTSPPSHSTSRFDASSKEIVIKADRYPTREENRRLCLEQLHRVLREGHIVDGTDRSYDSAFVGRQ